jgi:hypothetical protein
MRLGRTTTPEAFASSATSKSLGISTGREVGPTMEEREEAIVIAYETTVVAFPSIYRKKEGLA